MRIDISWRMRRFIERSVARTVASIYSWGNVDQKFPNDKKISEYFMAYEATKVFVIQKNKTQFTNNLHIFYAQTYYRSMQCCRKLFLIGG